MPMIKECSHGKLAHNMKAVRVGNQIALHFSVRGKERTILGRDEKMLIARAVTLGADVEEINITALPIEKGDKNERS